MGFGECCSAATGRSTIEHDHDYPERRVPLVQRLLQRFDKLCLLVSSCVLVILFKGVYKIIIVMLNITKIIKKRILSK